MNFDIPFSRKTLGAAIQAALLVAGSVVVVPAVQAALPTYDLTQVAPVTTTDANGNLIFTYTDGGPGGVGGTTPENTSSYFVIGGGLIHSDHDFQPKAKSGIQIGLCTFCHTPHKASTTYLLWNHTLSKNSFNWNVAATTSGTALPGFVGNTYNGPSAKCLSCHDGSVAIGDVGWFNDSTHTTVATELSTFHLSGDWQVGAKGDLTENHPVAIPYPYQGTPNVYNGSTTGKYLATDQFVSDPTQNNIRLYSDIGGDAIVGHPTPGTTGIECSSCHDPHNKASIGDFFLRGKLSGDTQASGYICLQCHVK